MMESVYPGYKARPELRQAAIGGAYAAVDGALGGACDPEQNNAVKFAPRTQVHIDPLLVEPGAHPRTGEMVGPADFHSLVFAIKRHLADSPLHVETKHRRARGLKLDLTDGAKRLLADEGYDPQLGARPLKRVIQRELADALAAQAQGPAGEHKPLGEIVLEKGVVRPAVVDAALEKQRQGREAKAQTQENRVLKVDAERLDQLINLVGELVIAGASAAVLAQRSKDVMLLESTSNISRLVEEIRGSALQLRMVQIGDTFRRFNRVVRDVSRDLGKDIQLMITGAETELDKTVVDKIGDPLTHLVRNAMDHGIEPAEERVAAGKPARGAVGLNAYHDSGNIVIEVSDDGSGLDKERILAKAVEKGLVPAGQTLSEQETYQLIFEPGFSTAAQVTNLSGRGVGMDVVRRNIEALDGAVTAENRPSGGLRVSLALPRA